MKNVLVWDLPTRLFHWIFAVGLLATFAAAQFTDEHSELFLSHMIVGIVLGSIVVLRVAWGIVGTRHARFSSFVFGPRAVLDYLRTAITASGGRFVGHNPGSSYSIFAMLFLTGTTVLLGILASNGSELAEETHVISAYTLLAVVTIHILGVVWYSIRHRENITLSMITGKKVGLPSDSIRSSCPIVAVVFIAIVSYLAVSLFRNFDPTTGQTKLPILGTVIQLQKVEQNHDGSEAFSNGN